MVFREITRDCVRVLRRRNALSKVKIILYNGRLFDGFGRYC
jgi:hypothetical protein